MENKEMDQELEKEQETVTATEETPEAESTAGQEKAIEKEAAEPEETGKEEASPETGKKIFGKKKDKAVAKLEEKVSQLEEARVRQLAEFENFRKRTDREKSQMFETGAKSVVEKILPVMDNFERGLGAVAPDHKEDPFVQGMEMVYKQMTAALEEMGVTPIEAVGKEFDPNLHNAVMAVDDDNLESGTVAEELQKGYMYRETVVRHSMVKVVN